MNKPMNKSINSLCMQKISLLPIYELNRYLCKIEIKISHKCFEIIKKLARAPAAQGENAIEKRQPCQKILT